MPWWRQITWPATHVIKTSISNQQAHNMTINTSRCSSHHRTLVPDCSRYQTPQDVRPLECGANLVLIERCNTQYSAPVERRRSHIIYTYFSSTAPQSDKLLNYNTHERAKITDITRLQLVSTECLYGGDICIVFVEAYASHYVRLTELSWPSLSWWSMSCHGTDKQLPSKCNTEEML